MRTMYDLMRDVFVSAGTLPPPDKVSFTRDVLPILRRLCDLQWVNRGIAALFGHGGREHFLAPGRSPGWPTPARATRSCDSRSGPRCGTSTATGSRPCPGRRSTATP
ncbi:hypothetical protein GCM10011428_56220 [Streptomyces violaceus]